MSYRYGGRLGANLENEQRRLQREPVAIWKKEWAAPAGAQPQADVKVLKWVKTTDVVRFDEEDDHVGLGDETVAVMEMDTTSAEAPADATVTAAPAATTTTDSLLAPPSDSNAIHDAVTPPVLSSSHDDESMADMSVAAATAVLEAAEDAAAPVSTGANTPEEKVSAPTVGMSLGSGLSLDGGAAARDTPPATQGLQQAAAGTDSETPYQQSGLAVETTREDERTSGAAAPATTGTTEAISNGEEASTAPVEAASLPALSDPALDTQRDSAEGVASIPNYESYGGAAAAAITPDRSDD